VSAQEEFVHIRQQFVDPIQYDYEVIRPIVLWACSHFSGQASSSARCEVAICFNRFHRPAL
jgi:hypothetical protein